MTGSRVKAATLLLLFDIDGTLLRGAAEAQTAALHRALTEVFGVRESETVGIETVGRTDLEIARNLLTQHGVAEQEIEMRRDELVTAWGGIHAELCPEDLTQNVLVGAAELLAELHRYERFKLSLVTGNLEPIARMKLERAGIGHYFASGQGGFGTDSERREELPPLARERAGRWPREDTVLIGDTPLDIACAKADGIRCVGVADSIYSTVELGGADHALEDISDLADLLRQW